MGEIYEHRDMGGSVFREVNLGNSKFENVNLVGTTFRNVNLGGVTFKNVNLAGATIPDANLAGLTIKDAEIRGLTIFGIQVNDLIQLELDRRDPERANLRIHNIFDPEAVREVMTRLDQLRIKFYDMLRSKDTNLLAIRPEPESWSAVEVVRHLVHAEDVYLNRFILRNNKPFIRLGLLPDHAANIPKYAEVGTEPTTNLETVLAVWESVHTGTREYVTGVTAEELRREIEYAEGTVGSLLQLLAHHDLLHIRQAEVALATVEQSR